MDKKRRILIKELTKEFIETYSSARYWKLMKELYLKLETDEEKQKFLANIFKDKKKEG